MIGTVALLRELSQSHSFKHATVPLMEGTGGIAEIFTISPAVWPGPALEVQPGDLTRFVPQGLGLGGPALARPWDTLEDVTRRPSYYTFNPPSSHPFLNAPLNDACGGVAFFDGRPARQQIDQLLALLDVRDAIEDYAAFWETASKPLEERYLEQIRIVAPSALTGLFGIEPVAETAPLIKQRLPVGEALWRFIEYQQHKYGRSSALQGVMGGDGDWAKESLAFGFMVENAYHGIYRIWSRAWLVTK